MKNFDGLGLHSVLRQSLTHMKYTIPTPIQAQAIPVALAGRDIMGSAQTGTGKTAAFAIPLVEALLNDERKTALVMTPTRELGKQVMEIMQQLLGPKSSIKTAFLIGGDPYSKQNMQLKRRPRLVVGTPGRINDHLERGNLHLDETRFLVLDETDRMLDMGFSVQIDRIVKYIPKERQTLMFSATMPKNIMSMADKYLINPERIAVGSTINVAENIDQKIIRVDQAKKYDILTNELQERSGSILIFVKTKRGADKLARKLQDEDHRADAIHGDLKQSKRDRVIRSYRSKSFRILVATDVVARGLDIPHIEHVINYDLPQMPEDYIHRIGRTARAGASGNALCLITPQDGRKWYAIEQLLNPDAHPSKPANESRPGKSHGRNRGKPFSAGAGRRNDRDGEKSSGYKGKRKFSNDRSERGGEQKSTGYKGKRDFSNDRNDRDGERKSTGYKGKRDFSNDRNSDSRPAKRSYSDDRSSDNRPAEGRYIPKGGEQKSSGERNLKGNQSNRSRDFAEKKAFEGKPVENKGSSRRSSEKRKLSGAKPTFKQDGDQPRRFKRPAGKSGKPSFGGGNKSGGFKGGNRSGGNKSNRAA